MRISDWSSDVCSAELSMAYVSWTKGYKSGTYKTVNVYTQPQYVRPETVETSEIGFKSTFMHGALRFNAAAFQNKIHDMQVQFIRSEEHTSELQSLMRISYAVFCLKKKNKQI